ncbi:hypothetical protein [Haladaptatus sp. T7]|uniref:hypothetical protein n=1 Tax=Haladaptatus sp. T7 TaxID=2029368 RepID=UPI002231FA64|nr:hypothetical protein [Haladaptatus sp. T7]
MPSDDDPATEMEQVREQSRESIEDYNGYESVQDALDAYAQAQIEEGNEVDMSSQARAAGMRERAR